MAQQAGRKLYSAIELHISMLILQVVTDKKLNAINQYHNKMLTDIINENSI